MNLFLFTQQPPTSRDRTGIGLVDVGVKDGHWAQGYHRAMRSSSGRLSLQDDTSPQSIPLSTVKVTHEDRAVFLVCNALLRLLGEGEEFFCHLVITKQCLGACQALEGVSNIEIVH